MTVKPRTRTEDERFLENARILSDVSDVGGGGFTLIFFIFIFIYIFARAIWDAFRDLREEKTPEKKQRVSTTPTHYPR
jgi:hypothetical protein